jgi:hypothetical protein
MKLNREAIEEFQQLYLRKEGKKLSSREALEIITNLLLAFDAIYHPIPKEDKGRLNKYNQKNHE